MNPPFTIPQKASSARAFVHSVTIPYVFPNVVEGENSLRIILPTREFVRFTNYMYKLSNLQVVVLPPPQPIYSSSCLQQLGSRSGTLSACTT